MGISKLCSVIDIKRETMTFEVDEVIVIQPLNPYQAPRFRKHVDDVEKPNILDQLHQLTAGKREDYINSTIYGSLNWGSVQHT